MASSDMAAAQAYWTEAYGHWPLTAEEAANELHDWAMALREVPKVYDELTRGRLTKPNTMAQYIIDAVRADQEASESELRAELESARRALATYADPGNWTEADQEDPYTGTIYVRKGRRMQDIFLPAGDGWEIAERAASGATTEDKE